MAQLEPLSQVPLPPDGAAPEKPALTAGPPAVQAGGLLTIDLGALVENWRTLGQRALPAECAAVVKADAYGCGLEPVAKALARAGCRTFFVADLEEARRARTAAPDAAIYVLGGLMPGTGPAFAEINARPVIGNLLELAEWDTFVAAADWNGGAALHVDTGMNRLGVTPDEAAALAPRIRAENHGIALLMSHLACAQEPEHPLNRKQIDLFREIRLHYRGIPSSLANSSGVFLSDAAHCDVVRPGVALYGVNPTPGRANPMRPVVGLQARILQVRHVARGEGVGYDAAWTARHASRIAIVAVGYGDGYPRAAGSTDSMPGADAVVADTRCPIAGRVSMDLIAIDVSDLPEGAARRGEMATLVGDGISVDTVANIAGTIGYEVLTRLGRRYHRVYRAA